jgi:hypothetical protein
MAWRGRRWVKPRHDRDRLELAEQLRHHRLRRSMRRAWWLAMGLAIIVGGLVWLSK